MMGREHGGALVCVGIDCCCLMPALVIEKLALGRRCDPLQYQVRSECAKRRITLSDWHHRSGFELCS